MKKIRLKSSAKPAFFLPSLFTLANLFFGFLAIILTFHGRYRMAAFWIIMAAVLDGMDGVVARATRSSSDFGIELDSLADAVSFGLATSVLLYFWGFKTAGPAGLLSSFLFLTAALLRLARYNVGTKVQLDRRHYQGLTVPSAAVFISAVVNFHPSPLDGLKEALPTGGLAILVAFFMISAIPYKNFIKYLSTRKLDLKSVIFLAVTLAGVLFYTKMAILVIFGINVISGPAEAAVRLFRRPTAKKWQAKVKPS